MNIIFFNEILLILLYSFIKKTFCQQSFLNNSNNNCSLFSDCFNCSIIPTCRWNSSIEECIPSTQSNSNFSLPQINRSKKNNNITILNNYFNFIKKACFSPTTPMINSNNNKIYNSISNKYCGNHYIITTENDIEKNFKIELNKINGAYAAQNLLCEYIFFSGPNEFDIKININEKDSNNFYLLFGKDILNISQIINSSITLEINMNPNNINTFLFYSLKSFDSPPFTITYKTNFWKKTVQATGYIMLALIIIIIAIIIYVIIYMRKNSSIFKKIAKKKNKKEKEKNIYTEDKSKIEEMSLMKRKSSNETNAPIAPSIIKNYTPETPINFLDKEKFTFEKCVFDGLFINNKEDIYQAKCGHFYHKNCYNKLIEDIKKTGNKKELKCDICQKDIYTE